MTSLPLRTRLLVPLLVLLLVGLAGAPLLATYVMTQHLDGRADDRLQASSRAVGGFLSGQEDVVVGAAQVGEVPTAGGLLLLGLAVDGEVVLDVDRRSPDAVGSPVAPLVETLRGARTGEAVHVRDGAPYDAVRVATPGLVVTTDDGDVRVAEMVIALDRSEDQAVVAAVRRAGTTFAVVAMVVLGTLAAWTLTRGLRPLTRLATVAGDDGSADGFRSATGGAAPELTRLGTALADAFEAREQAEASVRSFMMDASHELRTPLTGLSGWLDLYAQGGLRDPDELERAMERMESEVGRMRLLVDELDLLARLDQGRPLDLGAVRLCPMLSGIVEDVRVVDPERAVLLQVAGDPVVRADPPRLEQVVHNLVGNALQHTPAGTPIEVAATLAGDHVEITVADHGPGFDEAELDRVFDRFHRAESARREPGTGLGLAIVRGIVEAHGGTTAASVTPGGGATVTVRLPRVVTVSEPSGGP